MSTTACNSYQRLRNEEGHKETDREPKSRTRWPLRLKIKKRMKMKIPSLRRKALVVMATLAKVLKRLKESQSHLGDLFAGNYLFLQVTPTPLKSASHAIVTRGSIKKI
ncbi:hypothetical protein HanRHA438_Chr14g0666001 [Helianthus annuus]|nr:hypothetical protein HanRHA438_Chr14g0666001 [Helianthus annuus]